MDSPIFLRLVIVIPLGRRLEPALQALIICILITKVVNDRRYKFNKALKPRGLDSSQQRIETPMGDFTSVICNIILNIVSYITLSIMGIV